MIASRRVELGAAMSHGHAAAGLLRSSGKVINWRRLHNIWRQPPVSIRRHPPLVKRDFTSHDRSTPRSQLQRAQARRRAPQLRQARRGGARGVHRGRHVGAARGRRAAGRASGSGRSTGTSRRARRCWRRSTSTRSRRWPGRRTTSPTLPPWDALSQWLHQYVGFAATKRALTEALLDVDPDSDVLLACRAALIGAGTALVERAQRAGVIRPDTTSSTSGAWSAGSRWCRRPTPSRRSGCWSSRSTACATAREARKASPLTA